jgi:hypothetical protein
MKLRWVTCLAAAATGTRMVPLPQLPPQTEDLEHWLHNNIQQTRANDDWAAYQRRVLDWCAPFWRPEIVSDYDVLLDRDLWEAWSKHPPRFGNFTFVLLPWHHIIELHGFRRHAPGLNYAPLRDAAALFAKLSPHYPHVVVLSQADRRQILVMERRAGGATARQAHTPGSFSVATPLSDALSKVAVRFTTRLESLARLSAGKRPDPHDVPLPLLFRASREVNASSQERIRRIFFRGSCTSKLRNRLARDVVATATLAVDVGRCGQGGKSKYPDYAENLQKSLFVLAPRGSYPATFMLGEAVQAGALAVFVYEARMIRGKRLGGKRVKGGFRRAPAANETHLSHAAIEAQLPYANLGLRWGAVGAVATDDEVDMLPARLAALPDIRRRLRTTAWVRPLFTSKGARLYVELVLSSLATAGARKPFYEDS